MSLAVAVQMDPIETINIDTDTTFALMLEAQRRGHLLYHYLPRDLTWRQGRVVARARAVRVQRVKGAHASLGAPETIDLETLDVVLMRQDPPFNLAYISATHLLDRVHPRTLVVNDPHSVRNAPEKLFVTEFHELMPPSIITYDIEEIRAFRREYGDIIVKPIYGNGGAGVFHIKKDDTNLNSLIELFQRFLDEPLMVQQYLPAVREGDKRIILVDGKPVGAVNRVPAPDETRANLHVGGRPEPTRLTKRDLEICEAIGPALELRGLLLVGIDVIGGYLTEINVTSPTGIQEIDRFEGTNLAGTVWDAIEAKIAARADHRHPT
ncbi:MAG: glutathione synthase [Geminicoccaceae bacterium]|nr:glutathione synthase [Geminicoccaceae bacterium]MCS7267807.1 glutathione synthase [Geminicoccaceae bacterium]MCX7630078.1 glutathione synthase [Geminicoccaceae bacterium]MDW8124361.1 glutathione synthase [Geminicoccaceae bacterium]MDW8341830.1 glutathione synthase [Geminicoccaceae bacterium]